jgi:NADPH:quinone reductase-like Zn-dependent oxidoreductase
MRAAVMHETGGPEVLLLEDVPAPTPGPGELLVRVRAASVNPIDWKIRRGIVPKDLPVILGNDIAGSVEVSDAEGFGAGEDVFGFTSSGAYAEFALASPLSVTHEPGNLRDVEAAALPVAALTAWQALFDHGGLQAEQTVVIAGAAGGVGHLAVQFAKQAGAKVVGIASARNRDYVLGLGADEFIDYTTTDISQARLDADLAFDAVGGATTEALVACVRPGGVLITIAGTAPAKEAQAAAITATHTVMRRDMEQLLHIGRLVADGVVKVQIAETMPLEEVMRAHALSESGRTRGKIVLTL